VLKDKIYTIIVTYNGLKWIHECLDSVCQETTVIVIDNKSSDGTVAYIQSNFPEVIVLPQNENLGFGKANNLGITYALSKGADYVFLLNQDAKIYGNAVQQLIDFSSKNKQYGIISPIHCDWNGEFLESSFSRYVRYDENKDFYSDFVLNKKRKEIYDVSFIAAACWFIPKETLLNVGGFDPIFFHIGEDTNYVQRILFHDYKVGVLANCKIGHDTKNRAYPRIKKYSEKYFYKTNYHMKIKFADVRLGNSAKKVNYLKQQIYKDAIFALLQFKLSNFKGSLRELKELKKVVQESIESISINKNKGRHYI
jgi:GT2 family glycosyltransferase